MSEGIICSLISAAVTLIGVLMSNQRVAYKTETAIKVNQAVTDTKIENLTAEVRDHNNFARRMPVVEEQIKVINNRIKDLERKDEKK